MSKPSRLYRKLKPTKQLFRVYSDTTNDLSLDDDSIRSVVIHRGDSTPGTGPYPHTMEIVSNDFHLGAVSGESILCEMTDYGSSLMADMIGANSAEIQCRFTGRIGKLSTEDRGGIGTRGMNTTIMASSAHAQLSLVDKEFTNNANANLGAALQEKQQPGGMGQPITSMLPPAAYHGATREQFGKLAETMTFTGYNDAMTKLCSDTGIYAQTRRDGSMYFYAHEYRWDIARGRIDNGTAVPIARSQAIGPATWEQPNENLRRSHISMWKRPDGGTITYPLGFDSSHPNIPVVEYDMTHVVYENENQPINHALTQWYIERANHYRITSLRIDLLRLITSRYSYDRLLAKVLIEMEVGTPIYLSADWVGDLEGIHFAVGLEESITPDGWDLTINIANSAEVVGKYGVMPLPRIWEQFGYEWEKETQKWH